VRARRFRPVAAGLAPGRTSHAGQRTQGPRYHVPGLAEPADATGSGCMRGPLRAKSARNAAIDPLKACGRTQPSAGAATIPGGNDALRVGAPGDTDPLGSVGILQRAVQNSTMIGYQL